jgi:hypothetical protein
MQGTCLRELRGGWCANLRFNTGRSLLSRSLAKFFGERGKNTERTGSRWISSE